MTELGATAYGKRDIRLLCVTGDPAGLTGEEVTEAGVRVVVRDGPAESYLAGDNRRLVTTDTMRTVVTDTLATVGVEATEDAALAIAAALRHHYPFLPEVEVEVTATRWRPVSAADGNGRPGSGTAFARHGWSLDRAVASCTSARTSLVSGWTGPPLLLTRGSRFTGFIQDERTPNQPAEDRAIAGQLDLEWAAGPGPADHAAARKAIRSVALAAFQRDRSESVQHLLTMMCQQVLDSVRQARTISARLDSIPLTRRGPRAYVIGDQPQPQTWVSMHRTESPEGKTP